MNEIFLDICRELCKKYLQDRNLWDDVVNIFKANYFMMNKVFSWLKKELKKYEDFIDEEEIDDLEEPFYKDIFMNFLEYVMDEISEKKADFSIDYIRQEADLVIKDFATDIANMIYELKLEEMEDEE